MITIEEFRRNFSAALAEMDKVIIGQDRIKKHLLAAIFAEGHVLLTGVPGLGRTLIGETMAKILGLTHSRIQFTPDLLPTDILGAEVLREDDESHRSFHLMKGPIFANMILADEINRSPARTQSALLEAMQERQVTIGGMKHPVPLPFQLIATQNTVDTEGVYPLPEAQMDRFMMLIELHYPGAEEESAIMEATTGAGLPEPARVMTPETVIEMQTFARHVPVIPSVTRFTLRLVRATRPGREGVSDEVTTTIRWGASPRAGQCLLRSAKVLALISGRDYVSRADIREIAHPVLKHRVLPDYRAIAKGVKTETIVDDVIKATEEREIPKASRKGIGRLLVETAR